MQKPVWIASEKSPSGMVRLGLPAVDKIYSNQPACTSFGRVGIPAPPDRPVARHQLGCAAYMYCLPTRSYQTAGYSSAQLSK